MNLIFDELNRVSDAALPTELPIQIVCGTCAGNDVLPNKTNLTSDGGCSACGSRSFVLASAICGALAAHLKEERKENFEIWTPILLEKQEKF